MAPEQASSRKTIDARAAILYQAVTGERLYKLDAFFVMIHFIAEANFPTPSELGVSLPDSFEKVLLQALSRNPDCRYQTAEAFARALLPFASPGVRLRWQHELGVIDPTEVSDTGPSADGFASTLLIVDEPLELPQRPTAPRLKGQRRSARSWTLQKSYAAADRRPVHHGRRDYAVAYSLIG